MTPEKEIEELVAKAKEILEQAATIAAANDIEFALAFDGSTDGMFYNPKSDNWEAASTNDKWYYSDSCW